MDEDEFDKFADKYQRTLEQSLPRSGDDVGFFTEYKVKDTASLARRLTGESAVRIMDFGAGVGASVPYFLEYFPGCELTCLDVSKRSLTIGESRFGENAAFCHFDGEKLAFADNSFDLVFSACVFHHTPPDRHVHFLNEIHRVLNPGGLAVVFEHNPLNPLTVRTVKHCPFDENAILIHANRLQQCANQAGFNKARVGYRLFFPYFLRWLRPLESWMTRLPLGAQYYVTAQK